jgi:hypothetical protein
MRAAEGQGMVHRFRASRLSPGNRLFPTVFEVSHRHVSRIKASVVGQIEESISIRQVSSVTIARGTVWSEIVVHSSGGTDPLRSRGHPNADAQRLKQLIEEYQANIAATGVADTSGLRACPRCAELVKVAARVCRYCAATIPIDLTEEVDDAPDDPADSSKEWTWS